MNGTAPRTGSGLASDSARITVVPTAAPMTMTSWWLIVSLILPLRSQVLMEERNGLIKRTARLGQSEDREESVQLAVVAGQRDRVAG